MPQTATRETVLTLARDTYGTEPDYPWEGTPDACVLRHGGTNRKWYGLIMRVRWSQLKLPGEGFVDILNVKCDPTLLGSLRENDGYLPAYHMSKAAWLTVLLDGRLPLDDIAWLLTMSYRLTDRTVRTVKKPRPKKKKVQDAD